MAGSWQPADFPDLQERDHTVTSGKTLEYNCIAWAVEDTSAWWWPDPYNIGYWPLGVPRAVRMDAFVAAYQTKGYQLCDTPDPEEGFEKIALYANARNEPTHAARQLPNGHWTSKLGQFEDIEHATLDCLNGDLYGRPVRFLRRALPL